MNLHIMAQYGTTSCAHAYMNPIVGVRYNGYRKGLYVEQPCAIENNLEQENSHLGVVMGLICNQREQITQCHHNE